MSIKKIQTLKKSTYAVLVFSTLFPSESFSVKNPFSTKEEIRREAQGRRAEFAQKYGLTYRPAPAPRSIKHLQEDPGVSATDLSEAVKRMENEEEEIFDKIIEVALPQKLKTKIDPILQVFKKIFKD